VLAGVALGSRASLCDLVRLTVVLLLREDAQVREFVGLAKPTAVAIFAGIDQGGDA
jgi:hypothetical protein